MKKYEVLIVGSGFSGLTSAHYLKEEGIVQHMIEKNSRERDIHFDIKELLWASLILALNQIGEKVDRRRLEEAQEEAKKMWEYHD